MSVLHRLIIKLEIAANSSSVVPVIVIDWLNKLETKIYNYRYNK